MERKTRNTKGGNVEIVFRDTEIDDRDELILRAMIEAGEPLPLMEISRRTGMSRAIVWRKLRKLIARGIVEKVIVEGRVFYWVKRLPEDRGEKIQ